MFSFNVGRDHRQLLFSIPVRLRHQKVINKSNWKCKLLLYNHNLLYTTSFMQPPLYNLLYTTSFYTTSFILPPLYYLLYTTSFIQPPLYNLFYTTSFIQPPLYNRLYTTSFIQPYCILQLHYIEMIPLRFNTHQSFKIYYCPLHKY